MSHNFDTEVEGQLVNKGCGPLRNMEVFARYICSLKECEILFQIQVLVTDCECCGKPASCAMPRRCVLGQRF